MRTLDQAREFQNQGNFEEVDAIFEEILQEEPKNAEVIFMLAKSQMNQNKLDKALVTIDRALALNSEDHEFSQIKGSILARLGRYEEAIAELKKSLESNPNNYQSQVVLGHMYYSAGKKDEAETHFKMALKIDADKVDAQVNLAKLMMDDGDVERAIKKLTHIEKSFPQDPSVKMMMGQAFIENNAYTFAEKYFEKVREMLPEYALARLYWGIAKLYMGDVDFAEKIILGFNQKFKNVKEGLAAMGLLFFKKKRFKAAHDFLSVAVKDGMSPLSWRATLAEAQVALGMVTSAISFYKESLNKYHNSAHSVRLAELYEMNQDLDKAIEQYKKTDKTEVKYVLSLMGQARCELLRENYSVTEQLTTEILNIHENSPETLLLLANALLFQDKQEEALALLTPLDYKGFNYMFKKTLRVMHALILDHQGRYEEAMAVFTDQSKMDEEKIPQIKRLSENLVKKIQTCKTDIAKTSNEPIFVVGTQSTDIHNFTYWLSNNNIQVLNDRLISEGREDIFNIYPNFEETLNMGEAKVNAVRRRYREKVQGFLQNTIEGKYVDCLYTNPHQLALIKKYFPHSPVILLTRATADIWINQQAFGQEQIDSKDWNESINHIISMGLNLITIDIDDWHKNDEETLNKLQTVFDEQLQPREDLEVKYWRKTLFTRGHWKNYKQFLM